MQPAPPCPSAGAPSSRVAPAQHIHELLMEHSAPAKSQGMFSREQLSPRWGLGAAQPCCSALPRKQSQQHSPGVSLPPSIPHHGETPSVILAEGSNAALLTFSAVWSAAGSLQPQPCSLLNAECLAPSSSPSEFFLPCSTNGAGENSSLSFISVRHKNRSALSSVLLSVDSAAA